MLMAVYWAPVPSAPVQPGLGGRQRPVKMMVAVILILILILILIVFFLHGWVDRCGCTRRDSFRKLRQFQEVATVSVWGARRAG